MRRRHDDGPVVEKIFRKWQKARAERLSGDANNILYQFSVSHADRCLLAGRAAVVLDASALNKEQP